MDMDIQILFEFWVNYLVMTLCRVQPIYENKGYMPKRFFQIAYFLSLIVQGHRRIELSSLWNCGIIRKPICQLRIEITSKQLKMWAVTRYINYKFSQTINKLIKFFAGFARGPLQWYDVSFFVAYAYF